MPGSCLEPGTLLALALERLDPDAGAVARRHVEECPRCRSEVDRLRQTARHVAQDFAGAPPSGPCLDDIALAAVADGALDRDALRGALAHLERCPACRRELEALTGLLAEPSIRAGMSRATRGGTRVRRWAMAAGTLGLAAAAVLIVILRPPPGVRPPTPHRDTASADEAIPAAVEPVGSVTAVTAFSWVPVADADRYELLLFAADGTVLWEVTTAETYVVPPDSVSIEPGRSYFWRVRARVGYDQWSESPLHRFSMDAP